LARSLPSASNAQLRIVVLGLGGPAAISDSESIRLSRRHGSERRSLDRRRNTSG
jgi:hypothetical protein